MNGRFWIVCSVGMLVLASLSASAQFSQARLAQNRLQSGKWESAYRVLKKSTRKDSTQVENLFVFTQWYLASGNPGYHIDSADYYLRKATRFFDSLTVKERERVQRFPVDSTVLAVWRSRIDSVAFEEAKKINTEQIYIRYLSRFPNASQTQLAIELRDEVSYLSALKENTYQAFQIYLQKYPNAFRAAEAKSRYEKLLYEEKTKDKKLSAYKSFISQYPASPYAANVHQQIFEIMTAAGQPQDFLQYMQEYPATRNTRHARDFLFHLYKEWDEKLPASVLNDSLRNVQQLDGQFWIPVYKNGLFGFINERGEEVLPVRFDDVESDYKCEGVKEDILILKEGVFSRTGKKLAEAGVEINAIGAGFLEVTDKDCTKLIHKSGLVIVSDCYKKFRIVGDSFIVAIAGNTVSLFTLAGRPLPLTGLTDAAEIEDVLVLTRLGKRILVTPQQVAALADGLPLNEDFVFDDVQALAKGLLLVRNGALEGVVNSNLQFTVPLDRHTLTQTPYALLEVRPTGTLVHGLSKELSTKEWHSVSHHQQWLVLTAEGRIQLYHVPGRKMVATKADTVWFDQKLAFVQSENKIQVWISPTHAIDLTPDSKIRFIASRDSVQFFYTEGRNKRTVFNLADGEQLFSTEFELIESIENRYFVVAKSGKKGLLDRQGKIVVPAEMETIVLNPEGQLSLLKNRRFGLFDLNMRKLINPEYEQNVVPLNANHLIAFKDGKYGVMGWDTKPVTPFEYDEIVPWQGEQIWVKRNLQWLLINFKTQEVLTDRIKAFTWITRSGQEKVIRIQRENYYGIISTKRGMVIQPTFHEIVNLGTADAPFYFTEKQVEEAGIYVIIYYNAAGSLVRRQALEEEEYERLVCEDIR